MAIVAPSWELLKMAKVRGGNGGKPPHETTPRSRRDTAAYVAHLSEELALMAQAQRLSLLAYLLTMAAAEAKRIAEEERTNTRP